MKLSVDLLIMHKHQLTVASPRLPLWASDGLMEGVEGPDKPKIVAILMSWTHSLEVDIAAIQREKVPKL